MTDWQPSKAECILGYSYFVVAILNMLFGIWSVYAQRTISLASEGRLGG